MIATVNTNTSRCPLCGGNMFRLTEEQSFSHNVWECLLCKTQFGDGVGAFVPDTNRLDGLHRAILARYDAMESAGVLDDEREDWLKTWGHIDGMEYARQRPFFLRYAKKLGLINLDAE